MIFDLIVARDQEGNLWLKNRAAGKAVRVCTASDAAKRIRRSRRQIYRQIQSGQLPVAGRLGREILIPEEAVATLRRTPLARAPLPQALQSHFPEYEIGKLNASRDAVLIATRILERGALKDARWLFRRYGKTRLRKILSEEGKRLLSERSSVFWSGILGVKPARTSNWREKGEPWRQK